MNIHKQDENVSPNVPHLSLVHHTLDHVHEQNENVSLISPHLGNYPSIFGDEHFDDQPQFNTSMLPLPLTELYSEEYRHIMCNQSLSERAKEIFRFLSFTQEDCDIIEKSTRLQRKCLEWHKQRKGRLTASVFHDVMVKKSQTNCESLVKKFLIKKDISHIPAIKWGIDHESDGRTEYIRQMTDLHQQFKCIDAGLVINPLFPHLGASPDGFTECKCCGKGILELKCPFSCKEGIPDDLIGKRGSFMTQHGLMKTHKYFTQVQGQLSVCNREFCDFVVWTPQKTTIQRIYQDYSFIEKLLKKLTSFFVDYMLPELLTHHIQQPFSNKENTELYCFCQQQEHGNMIQCDNRGCQYQWFHFSCIGMDEAPEGSWYCPECQDKT